MNVADCGPIVNLEVFLRTLKRLPCCRSTEDFFSRRLGRAQKISGGGFFLSTGTESASENWAFVPLGVFSEEEVAEAVAFFERCGTPFIWPLLPTPQEESCRRALGRYGLKMAGTLVAMSRASDAGEDVGAPLLSFESHRSREGAEVWADAVWQAFGAEEPAPRTFEVLARELCLENDIRLVTARLGDAVAGAFLLCFDPLAAGVYYFAVVPRFRRCGVARAMMAEVSRLARAEKKERLTLQATPSGTPFYRSVGFDVLFPIPLFSASPDVF